MLFHQEEQTLAIIKPDAIEAGLSGPIIEMIELNGFEISCMDKRELTQEEAEEFYSEHKEREFFPELISFITSGPVILMALEAPDAVSAWRELMGDTNPQKARIGTLRHIFGQDIGKNAVHGSDSLESAQRELNFFFPCEQQ